MQENVKKAQNSRPKKKTRPDIPDDLASEVEFLSDMTCCVCRIKGRPIQIHHIDENPANNKEENLAVLCLDCHNKTQLQGGFGRKLNTKVVIQYRDDWLARVSKKRESYPSEQEIAEMPFSDTIDNDKARPKSAEQHLKDMKRRVELAQKRASYLSQQPISNNDYTIQEISSYTLRRLSM